LFPQLKGYICECGHSPLCRHHHRGERAEGGRPAQPELGVLIWRTPPPAATTPPPRPTTCS